MSFSQSLPLQRSSFNQRRLSIFTLFPEHQEPTSNLTRSKIESLHSILDGSADSSTIPEGEALENQYRSMLRHRLAACGSYSIVQSHTSVLSESTRSDAQVLETRSKVPKSVVFYEEKPEAAVSIDSAPSHVYNSSNTSRTSSPSIQYLDSMFSPKNSPPTSESTTSVTPAKQIYPAHPPSPDPPEWPTAAELIQATLDPLRPENWLVQSISRKVSELWFYGIGRNTPTFLSAESSITTHSTRRRRREQTLSSSIAAAFIDTLSCQSHLNPRPASPLPTKQSRRCIPLTPITLRVHNAFSTLAHLPSLQMPKFQLSPGYKSILLLPLSTILRAYDFWTPPKSATQWNTTMQRASTLWGAWWTDTTFNSELQNAAQWIGGELCFSGWCCGSCCNGY